MIKNARPCIVRTAGVLTGSYVAGTVIDEAHNYNQLTLYIDYVKGSLTSLEIKVEYSDDSIVYRQDANITPSGGTNTIVVSEYTYTGNDANFVLDMPINTNFIKVSVKGTGTATDSSVSITGILAYV